MTNITMYRLMPPDLKAQCDVFHQKIMDALDRYDFEEALTILLQERELRETWHQQCAEELEPLKELGKGVNLAS